MYVSHLLEKEASMYPGSKGSENNPQAAQVFVSTAQSPDFMGYQAHNLPSMENHGPSLGCWGGCYGLPGEDWGTCGPGPSSISTGTPTQIHRWPSGQVSFASADYGSFNPAGSVALSVNPEPTSPPPSQRLGSYEWMRESISASCGGTGKTRTKEKYRVVYTDQQRLELEKEFHCNRYITLRRKSELAVYLGLSERQIKIWFQNRRAKERKLIKKKISQFDGNGGSAQSESGSASPADLPASLFSAPHAIHGLQPLEILQIMATD